MIRFPDIERMLLQTIGMDPSTIGSPAIARAAQARMQSIGAASPDDYWLLLQQSPDELQELIEAVVVSETWFFRDKEPFSTLSQAVKGEWRHSHADKTLRILSLPCATGEEPYSIAMALMDAGIPADSFSIDAMDISLRVLEHARRGVYGNNAFRGDDLNFRDRYFRPVEKGHLISEIVRECVDFRQANLLAHDFGNNEGLYDFVFCRNVLIYFDDDAQARAVAALKRLLAPDGILFVGHAEVPLLTSRGFAYFDPPSAFACRKQSAVQSAPERRVPPVRIARPALAAVKPRRPPAPLQKGAAPVEKKQSDLEAICRLADRGQLNEAADLCITHLQQYADSAHAHYLLGLTRDAVGNGAQAAEHYRKALYLDPNHSESLAHLALLLESQGDSAGARRLNVRVGRAGKNSR